MQVTSNLRANNENCSFSNFTKSSASFSIFSWKNLVIVFEIITLSNPWLKEKLIWKFICFPNCQNECRSWYDLHVWCMSIAPNWLFFLTHYWLIWWYWLPSHNPECTSTSIQLCKNLMSTREHYAHCWMPMCCKINVNKFNFGVFYLYSK